MMWLLMANYVMARPGVHTADKKTSNYGLILKLWLLMAYYVMAKPGMDTAAQIPLNMVWQPIANYGVATYS